MQIELDSSHFLADLADLTRRIRELKRALGTRWWKPMADEQRELARAKLRATELCVLRAFTRGRLHFRRAPGIVGAETDAPEYHRRVAERLAPIYSAALEKSA